jgi:hypothetical protein
MKYTILGTALAPLLVTAPVRAGWAGTWAVRRGTDDAKHPGAISRDDRSLRLAHDIWAVVTYIEAGLPAGSGHPAR